MRVLVTGATGFTGGRLAELLAERGDQVIALARPGSRTEHLQRVGCQVFTGDITSPDDVRRAAEGCRAIYHIAALYRSAKHPDSVYHAVNVDGTRHVIDAARAHGVERLVHCSTIGVHGPVRTPPYDENSPFAPADIYQRTKLQGEQLAHAAAKQGLPVAVVRPAGIYGPGDLRFLKLFKSIHAGRFRMIGSGKVFYHFTYVDDLCRLFMACVDVPAPVGGTYVGCGETYHQISDVARIIGQAVGTPVKPGSIPLAPVMAAAVLCEGLCRPLGIEPPIFRRRLDFFIKHRAFTGRHATEELGFMPQVDLETGFMRTAAWYFAQGHLPGPMPEHLRAHEHACTPA